MLFLILVSLFLLLPINAHAYLDPGSGSYLLQLLLAMLFGALASIKIFWSRIKAFLSGLFSKKKIDGINN
jgi:hypothetical protein